jgi:flagellar protein FlaF
MSFQAYQQAAQLSESPRQTEYRLFGLVTRALMEAAASDRREIVKRVEAIDWNRRLWTTLAADCSQPENRLPDHVRAQIISLSLFVVRQSTLVARGEATFDTLIEVNRAIMQGLATQAEAA